MPSEKLALDDDRERVSAYAHIRVFESDYDRAQGQLRVAASTWIVAAVGGILLAYSGRAPKDVDPAVAAAFVCLLASSGLGMLWLVDQRVYQRLLHSAYSYGLAVEFHNPDLPQIRSAIYRVNKDIGWELGVFYFGPIVLFTAFSLVIGAAYWFHLVPYDETDIAMDPWGYGFAVLNAALLGALLFVNASPEKRPRVETMLARFSGEMVRYFNDQDGGRLNARLAAHQLRPKSAASDDAFDLTPLAEAEVVPD